MGSLLFHLLVFVFLILHLHGFHVVTVDPTLGFTLLPLNNSNFHVLSPYNLNTSSRYSFIHGIHKLWVLASDMPHAPQSLTLPRTELDVEVYHYASGVWQFEGQAYIPSGTTGVCIMQIFGMNGTNGGSTMMLRVYNGALMYYRRKLVMDGIYGRWFQLNVIHDVGSRNIKVFIDNELKLDVNQLGGDRFSFKFGVYMQKFSSYFMESMWKGIKIMKLLE
ncbi:hypothetical protein J5N97_021262 [Dioscorea zingiberensis]|uniref:Alginate lyase 2 domain-containing protein n=1 Tax=Dioscorea zingiberensis TaxID=325984 RepID=A0A9D5CHC7_9LILI|nr:hypothetical protein J5N97_021262 [Dioscorea zingiberensis]